MFFLEDGTDKMELWWHFFLSKLSVMGIWRPFSEVISTSKYMLRSVGEESARW